MVLSRIATTLLILSLAVPTLAQDNLPSREIILPPVDLVEQLDRMEGALIRTEVKVDELSKALEAHIKSTEAFQEGVKSTWEATGKPILTFTVKYILPAVVGLLIGKQVAE